eukprot:GHVU01090446.1.p1 GENE.GHVU01090446.1~~GHVU01090446.1.p1  ORF type:complete len:154 (+),score=16.05 GHVU01090446.1:71-532(+)
MASYFDEHNCEPLKDGEQPNHLLHLARLLIDTGLAREWDVEYSSLFGGSPSPPASKEFVKSLPTKKMEAQEKDVRCEICQADYEVGEETKRLPCKHFFHSTCIQPWLDKTNTCPLCRQELPTDDARYEEFKKQKARQKQRDFELETLHDSMFG